MPHTSSLLATIAISLALAYLGAIGARALRLPTVVGYLLAGVAIGPFTPGFVADSQAVSALAEIGVALLLFGVGIHFSVQDLVAVWRIAVPGALLQVAISTSVAFAVARLLFGWPVEASLVLGVALAIASTAVATRGLEERNQLRTTAGKIGLGWLVMQDLIVVFVLVLLPTLVTVQAGGAAAFAVVVGRKLLEAAGFAAAVLIVGRKAIPWLLAWTARDGSRELFRLAVIVAALGVAYSAAASVGVSLALGAFFAGVVLAESDLSHHAAAESVPVQQIFTVLFFVSVGMLFDPAVLVHAPLRVVAVVLTILLGTGGVTLLILIAARVRAGAAVVVAASLAQIAEFSFILTGLAVGEGLLPAEGRDLVLAAAIVTIMLNPFLFRGAEKLGALLDRSARLRRWERGPREAAVQRRASRLSDHVIVVGHGRVGSIVAGALRDEGVPYIVVEQNLSLARRLREEGVPAVYGDAGWPEVLGAAYPETARLLIVAIPERGNVRRIVQAAREANPNLPAIVRTHSDSEAEWLRTQAIQRIVISERRTADQIAEYALASLRSKDVPESGA